MRFSRSCTAFHLLEQGDPQPQFLRWLLEHAPDGAVVLPCDDDAVEVVARHRGSSSAADPDRGQRRRPAGHARQGLHLCPRPQCRRARADHDGGLSEADLEAAIEQIGFPCALKPRHIHEFVAPLPPQGVRRRGRRRAAARVRRNVRPRPGDDRDRDHPRPGRRPTARCSRTSTRLCKPLVVFTKRKLRQNPPGFGVGCYHITQLGPAVAEMGLRFLQAADFRGIANVEFKRDARDGTLKMIECNARFTAANELSAPPGSTSRTSSTAASWASPSRAGARPRRRVHVGARAGHDVVSHSRRRGELSLREWAASLPHASPCPCSHGAIRCPPPSTSTTWPTAAGRRSAAGHVARAGARRRGRGSEPAPAVTPPTPSHRRRSTRRAASARVPRVGPGGRRCTTR